MIDPNPFQPRAAFPDPALDELASSIRTNGVLQPVLLRRAGERYQLVAGQRRWRAAKLAGLESVPAIVRTVSDREALELALTENLLRDDLNPVEVARAYDSLQHNFGLTQDEIADRLGVSRTAVTNTLRLLRLPPSVLKLVEGGQLSAGHARCLLSLEAPTEQERWARAVVNRGMSVRQLEMVLSPVVKPGPASKSPADQDPNLRAAVLELERTLGTRVRITGEGRKGRIEIHYFSLEDLNRIYDLIVGST